MYENIDGFWVKLLLDVVTEHRLWLFVRGGCSGDVIARIVFVITSTSTPICSSSGLEIGEYIVCVWSAIVLVGIGSSTSFRSCISGAVASSIVIVAFVLGVSC